MLYNSLVGAYRIGVGIPWAQRKSWIKTFDKLRSKTWGMDGQVRYFFLERIEVRFVHSQRKIYECAQVGEQWWLKRHRSSSVIIVNPCLPKNPPRLRNPATRTRALFSMCMHNSMRCWAVRIVDFQEASKFGQILTEDCDNVWGYLWAFKSCFGDFFIWAKIFATFRKCIHPLHPCTVQCLAPESGNYCSQYWAGSIEPGGNKEAISRQEVERGAKKNN